MQLNDKNHVRRSAATDRVDIQNDGSYLDKMDGCVQGGMQLGQAGRGKLSDWMVPRREKNAISDYCISFITPISTPTAADNMKPKRNVSFD
ncbi:hypothetical protein [Pseudomonas sp. L1(2025)]|uniref:hypothetical protein n=1 Tax=Pseudomonas sp. L1(2025) TaxID=3449429 RepID=UPI003F68E410